MKFKISSIDHVLLAAPAECEAEASYFYRDILGFREIAKPKTLQMNGGIWFQAGNVILHIGIEEPFIPAKKAHPAICVKNMKALKDHLRKHQFSFHEDSQLPGAERFFIFDPFGNRLEFLEWLE